MSVSPEQIRTIFSLSHITFIDKDKKLSAELNNILNFVKVLDHIDLSDICPEVENTVDLRIYREKNQETSLARATLMSNAPETSGSYFLFPKTICEVGDNP